LACDLPPRQCFEWHILPKLEEVKPSGDGKGVRALCPAHDDHEQSFGIALADSARKRVVYNCFACKNNVRVRLALHRKYGIDLGCLPLSSAEKEDLLDRLHRIATADTKDHGVVRLSVVAALEGYEELPHGGELDQLSGLAHVHRATGHRARASTANPCSYTRANERVKPASSEAVSEPPEAVA
jgi:hypothetical protein